MRIKLDEKHFIVSGYGSSVNLVKTADKPDKDGVIKDITLGYFHDVAAAADKYIKLTLNNTDKEYDSLSEYIKDFKKLQENILKLV